MFPLLLLALALLPMGLEALLAARHDRALRSVGATEPPNDVFPAMQVAYPAAFLGMALEAWRRGARADGIFLIGIVAFAAAKGIKYWAIATLGSRWTFRVLVPPAAPLIITGPYRFMRHPNYLGVMGELAGMALMAHAPLAGAASVVIFGLLLARRIRVEERALGVMR